MLTKNALTVLEKRYLQKNSQGEVCETPEDMFHRVAKTISEAEAAFKTSPEEIERLEIEFFELLSSLDFLPNSPTLMNAGRELGQLSACFVLPIEDSLEGIFETIKNTALIHQSGGGTGFSFSRLRPARDVVQSTKGVSSGPISFMEVFNAATETIKQGGARRGANMGILRIDHPNILDFIRSKKDTSRLTNFNLSVAITDRFMDAVKNGQPYELLNPRNGQVVGQLDAREVFDEIVEGAWASGEPGVIFIDRINRDNPTPKVGQIESTNPCGEQPLLPYESCNLGSINLSNMVVGNSVDWERLRYTTRMAVRFLDDVIEVNRFPLPQIEEMTKSNRKIGLGVMGWADFLTILGISYDSAEAIGLAERVMDFITKEARACSVELGAKRGSFPNFEGSIYAEEYPCMRNATVTTIAPTGTLSIIAGCSSGIEPLFAISYIRNIMDGTELLEVHPHFEAVARERGFYSEELMRTIAKKGSLQELDEIPEDIKKSFITSYDITPDCHVQMQAAFQRVVDNAISKTINFPEHCTREDVAKSYHMAYQLGCKGITAYRNNSRTNQVLNIGSVKKDEAAPTSGNTSEQVSGTGFKVVEPRTRPDQTRGITVKTKTGCGHLYVSINWDEFGLCEVFARMGKSGGCAASQAEATGRLVSLALRAGIKPEVVASQLEGIRCPSPTWEKGQTILSCSDAIAKVLKHFIQDFQNIEHSMPTFGTVVTPTQAVSNPNGHCPECPDCGAMLAFEEGCVKCPGCGFSRCG